MSLNSHEYARAFGILDKYARRVHRCFVTEFFLSTDEDHYSICLRPLDVTQTSNKRFICTYIELGLDEARLLVQNKHLSTAIAAELDQKLSLLRG